AEEAFKAFEDDLFKDSVTNTYLDYHYSVNRIKDLKADNEKTLEKFLRPLAENLIGNAKNKIVLHVLKDSSQDEVKHLFKLITEINHEVAALLACENSEGVFIMFGTNKENKNIDVRQAFKKAIAILEGKGGGSSFSAQGFADAKNSEKLDEALNEAEKELSL
ncbi:MAG: hypothetical protein IKN30_02710, partial [Synergistaceae bacterium]|nr:hypothetical protein [Synergistaceae bacterium]